MRAGLTPCTGVGPQDECLIRSVRRRVAMGIAVDVSRKLGACWLAPNPRSGDLVALGPKVQHEGFLSLGASVKAVTVVLFSGSRGSSP